jgi:hypothetical protein
VFILDVVFAIVVGLMVAVLLAAVVAIVIDDRPDPDAIEADSERFAARR